jgi:Gpi18-like mannosyltransferase
MLYRLAELDVGPDAARLTVLLTALFPSGFFYLAPYTEGLFLALSVAALWLARSGRPWAAGLAGYGAVLTRTVGVVLVLPLAYEHLRRHRLCSRGAFSGLPAAALPVAGLAATVAYQHFVVGDPATPLDLSWQGDRAHVAPWNAVADSWAFVNRFGDPIEALNLR